MTAHSRIRFPDGKKALAMANDKILFLRQQLLVDQPVQGMLLKRTGLYSVACALYFVVILIFAESMSRKDGTIVDAIGRCFEEAIYWAPGLFLLAPLVAYDMLKLTNRFAGPIFRLRREMQRLIVGESERPLNFRDGDYWTEIAEEFNHLRDELMELRKENAELKKNSGSKKDLLFEDSDRDESNHDDLLEAIAL